MGKKDVIKKHESERDEKIAYSIKEYLAIKAGLHDPKSGRKKDQVSYT